MLKKIQNKVFLFILFVSTPLFFLGGPNYYSHRLLNEFWNLGHLLFFGVLAVWFDNYLIGRVRSTHVRLFWVLVSIACLGLLIEVAQLNTANRSFSWSDVARDLSGGIIVICYKTGKGTLQKGLLRSFGTLILLGNLAPFFQMSLDEYRAHRDFPLLASFETKLELNRWGNSTKLSRSKDFKSAGLWSGKVTLSVDKYSGVSLRHFPRDWSTKTTLSFRVYNPGPELKLHYRVHDKLHRGGNQQYSNRFNESKVLKQGWNTIIIPMADILNGPRNRVMDLTEIQGFGLFVFQQTIPRVIYIDDVRLH